MNTDKMAIHFSRDSGATNAVCRNCSVPACFTLPPTLTAIKLSAGIANLQMSEVAESRLCWSGACTELSRNDSQSHFVTNLTCAEPVEVWQ
jgi:hypothetical protein